MTRELLLPIAVRCEKTDLDKQPNASVKETLQACIVNPFQEYRTRIPMKIRRPVADFHGIIAI